MSRVKGLTLKQEIFCQEWVDTVGNGTESALKAFDIKGKEFLLSYPENPTEAQKIEKKRLRDTASAMGREMLRIPKINKRIDQILEERGFTDEAVKKEHYKVLRQDEDLGAKGRAISDFYKLKGRYEPEKVNLIITSVEEVKKRIANLKKK